MDETTDNFLREEEPAIDSAEFFNSVNKWNSFMRRAEGPVLKKYDIDRRSFYLLQYLSFFKENNTAHDFGLILNQEKGIVSVLVNKVMEQGLVEALPDQKDRRIRRLFLTEKALPIVNDGRIMMKWVIHILFRGLSAAERESVRGALARMAGNILDAEQKVRNLIGSAPSVIGGFTPPAAGQSTG